jgi:hypothetical protein
MDFSTSPEIDAFLREIRGVFTHPVPRSVPEEIRKAAENRLFRMITAVFGFFLFLFIPAMLVLEALSEKGIPSGNGLLPTLFLIIPFSGVFFGGLILYRKTPIIVSLGKLYEGKIVKIRRIPTHFYGIAIEFTDEYGKTHRVWDAVENRAIEYFQEVFRKNGKVELVFTPQTPRMSVLLMKMAYQRLFKFAYIRTTFD